MCEHLPQAFYCYGNVKSDVRKWKSQLFNQPTGKMQAKTRRFNFKETIRTSLSQRGAKVSLKFQGCKKHQNSTGNLCFGCTDIWLYRRWGASFLFILRNILTPQGPSPNRYMIYVYRSRIRPVGSLQVAQVGGEICLEASSSG